MEGINNLSATRFSRANEFQKEFFPFEAFTQEDPNVVDDPVLELASPWRFSAPGGIVQIPPGIEMLIAAAVAPDGWLLCEGDDVSRTTYAALFAKIGTTFGVGDGTTTFGLPDLSGDAPAGHSYIIKT
jgi:hypothetical protein